MAGRTVSQRSIVQIKKVLQELTGNNDMREVLYEQNLPDWFIRQTSQRYSWNWMEALWDLRGGKFFYPATPNYLSEEDDSIVPDGPFKELEPTKLGEVLIRKLAAVAVVLSGRLSARSFALAEFLPRSLQLDGFDVDKTKVDLVPLEGPVSAQQEEDHLTKLVKASGVPATDVVLQHIEDASSNYEGGKYHSSLGESRSLIQALIDGISTETDANGKHSKGLPGGTGPRIEYLKNVAFLTPDEEAAFKSAWGSLSAGSHPGVPEREQARIGLVLALEFGQLLLIKFANWKANAYRSFS